MSSPRRSRWSSRPSRLESDPEEPPATPLDLYRIAIEEYRFQVTLYWSRTQYFIALNLAVLGLATTVMVGGLGEQVALGAASALYAVGVLCALLALAAGRTQRACYHSARDRMKSREAELRLEREGLSTTPGMGGPNRRWGKVHQVHTAIIRSVLVLDVVGLGVAVALL